jgi:hypothetical protein
VHGRWMLVRGSCNWLILYHKYWFLANWTGGMCAFFVGSATGREGAGHCREYEARATVQGSRCTDQRDQCPTEADYLRA